MHVYRAAAVDSGVKFVNRYPVLFQTANGNVEAKVMCFFRRRDLPPTLVMLADKHQCK